MPAPYLVRRRATWYIRVRVPRDLRPFLGTHLLRSTRTGRLPEARALVPLMLTRCAILMNDIRRDAAAMGRNKVETVAWRDRMREADERYTRGESVRTTIDRSELAELLADLDPREQERRRDAAAMAEAFTAALFKAGSGPPPLPPARRWWTTPRSLPRRILQTPDAASLSLSWRRPTSTTARSARVRE